MRLLMVAIAVAGSCSAGADEATILVSRQLADDELVVICDRSGPRCHADFVGGTYRTADGGVAVASRSESSFDLELGDVPEITCGSEVFVRAYAGIATEFESKVPGHITFEDGSTVRLLPERAVEVHPDTCLEVVGSWEGMAGRYSGRRGPYRLVEDRLQATLTLWASSR